jgi:hypothetical protein
MRQLHTPCPYIDAACAIGRDRAFTKVTDLSTITVPTLVVPGADARRPAALAVQAARTLPRGQLADVSLSDDLRTAADLAHALAPAIRAFLAPNTDGPERSAAE